MLIIANFTPATYHQYQIGVTQGGEWQEIANSDAEVFGGSGQVNRVKLIAQNPGKHHKPYSLNLTIPPLGILFLKPIAETEV